MRTSPFGMRRRFVRTSLLAVVVSGLLGSSVACSDDDSQPSAPTITALPSTTGSTSEPTSTTTEPTSTSEGSTTTERGNAEVPAPDAVDAAYVGRVLPVLLESYRAFLVQVKGEGQVSPAARATLGLAFTPAAATNFANRADPAEIGEPQPAPVRDVQVLASGEGCILASADIDVSTWFVPAPDLVQPFFVRLYASTQSGTVTPWLIDYIGTNELGEPPGVDWECP